MKYKIGVYVGSFDPFHKGHENIVKYLLEREYVDKVMIIPTLSYWDKNIKTSIEDRINMIKTIEDSNIEVNTSLNTYEYTYEIMDELKKQYPEDNLYLIIGADSLVNFDKWKEVEKILENNILVIPRNNIDTSKYISDFKEKDKFIVVSDFVNLGISSTMIRERLVSKDYNHLDKYMNKKILNYIIDNNLYTSKKHKYVKI